MGYTHYWRHSSFSDEEWDEICARARSILNATDVPLQWEYDVEQPPQVNHEAIRFNGVEDDGHETFYLEKNSKGEFCKTARKPYDEVVVALLTTIDEVADHFSWSGGEPEQNEPGLELLARSF